MERLSVGKITRLAKSFDKLKTDSARWKWVTRNKSHVTILLDNDSTKAIFNDDKSEDPIKLYFAEDIGLRGGTAALLLAFGIKSEEV